MAVTRRTITTTTDSQRLRPRLCFVVATFQGRSLQQHKASTQPRLAQCTATRKTSTQADSNSLSATSLVKSQKSPGKPFPSHHHIAPHPPPPPPTPRLPFAVAAKLITKSREEKLCKSAWRTPGLSGTENQTRQAAPEFSPLENGAEQR